MILSGTVENIIFRNQDNGYSVIVLDVNGEPITCVGNFSVVSEGQQIDVEGEYKTGKYGPQFPVR